MKTATSRAFHYEHIGEILVCLAIVALLLVSPDLRVRLAVAASDEISRAQEHGTPVAERDAKASATDARGEDSQSPEEQWGIKIESVRMSAAGHMVDFRYRVLDPEKAGAVFDRRNKAFLMDEASGAMLPVPRTAKVGPLRQTNFRADTTRIYFVLFSNHGGYVKSGSLVSFIVGDKRIENIKVQ
jgi:hypothetical protein